MISCDFYDRSTEKGCVWNRCDLSHNKLTACKGFMLHLEGCKATAANFEIDVQRQVSNRLIVGGISCHRSNLVEANFSTLNLEGSTFDCCDLRGVDFSKCNLTSVNFVGSNMSNLHLFRADLTGAKIAHADIDDLTLDDVVSLDELRVSQDQHEKILSFFRIRTDN